MTTDSISSEATAVVQTIAQDIENRLPAARGASEASLQEYRAIGEALIKAKPLLPGCYLKWAKETFGFGKQWCSNLTFLAASWNEYQQAKARAKDQGQLAGGKADSVEGAVALVKGWKKASDPSPKVATAPQRPKLSEVKADLEAARAEAEAARVKIQERDVKLAEALAENCALKAQLAALSSRGDACTSEPTGPVDWTSLNQNAEFADVAAQALCASTVGEEELATITIGLGQSEYDAPLEDAAADDISLNASLQAIVLTDASDRGDEPWPREATELETALQMKGVGYFVEQRLRTLDPNGRFLVEKRLRTADPDERFDGEFSLW